MQIVFSKTQKEHQSLGWKACRLNLTKTFTPIGLELTDRIYWRIRELGMIERRRSYSLVKLALWKYRQRMSVLFPDVLFRNRVIYKILGESETELAFLLFLILTPERIWYNLACFLIISS